jgi:hypothetical protein
MTREELERLNQRLGRLGLQPLKRTRGHERLLRIEAAARAVAADGQVIRREFSGHVISVR